jgi:tol-pal system protein YbgF
VQDKTRLQTNVQNLSRIERNHYQQIQERLDRLEDSLNQLQERTERLVDQQTDSVRLTQADLWSQVNSHRVQLATLKGTQELLTKRLQQLTNSTEHIQEFKKKISELKQNQQILVSQLGVDIDEGRPSDRVSQDQGQSSEETQLTKTPQKVYEEALDSFKQRDYERAKNLWSEFIENFTKHDLVPNAYFWLGECSYQQKEYGQAILQYQKVVEQYPKSDKIPSALLKQGLSFYKLGKSKAGKITLQRLVDKYPDSPATQRARIYLKNE